jgi:hypothetical protein
MESRYRVGQGVFVIHEYADAVVGPVEVMEVRFTQEGVRYVAGPNRPQTEDEVYADRLTAERAMLRRRRAHIVKALEDVDRELIAKHGIVPGQTLEEVLAERQAENKLVEQLECIDGRACPHGTGC